MCGGDRGIVREPAARPTDLPCISAPRGVPLGDRAPSTVHSRAADGVAPARWGRYGGRNATGNAAATLTEVEAGPAPAPAAAELEAEKPDGAAAAPAEASEPDPSAAEAARAQAAGRAAVAVRGHPDNSYNVLFTRSPEDCGGWPQYVLDLGDGDSLYLFRHTASGRWVFSFTTEEEDLEALATILTPEGPVPLGEHVWCAGKEVRLTVTALTTGVEAEEHSEQQRAEAEAAKQAACTAARE